MSPVLPYAVRILSAIAALAVSVPALAADPAARCQLPRDDAALSAPLPQMAQRIAAGAPIRIVAIGSSSTAGAGASSQNKSYPARLDHYLSERFRNTDIAVLNRGINGETDDQTEKRIEADALSVKPDLVIWQVGANTVLRDGDQGLSERSIRRGVAQLRAAGVEVVLMDLQYAPKMLEKAGVVPMLTRITGIATDNHIGLFHRFDVMRSLVKNRGMTVADLIGPDGVHQNDVGYDCVARILAVGIEDAVNVHNSGLQR